MQLIGAGSGDYVHFGGLGTQALGAVMDRYALDMDMDSMGRLIAEHGLNAPPATP